MTTSKTPQSLELEPNEELGQLSSYIHVQERMEEVNGVPKPICKVTFYFKLMSQSVQLFFGSDILGETDGLLQSLERGKRHAKQLMLGQGLLNQVLESTANEKSPESKSVNETTSEQQMKPMAT